MLEKDDKKTHEGKDLQADSEVKEGQGAGNATASETSEDSSLSEKSIVSQNSASAVVPERSEKKKKEKKQKKPRYKRSRMKKIIIFIIILGIIGFAVYKFTTPKPDLGLPVSTGTAETMDIEQVVTVKGTVEGAQTADISSAVDYEVISINVVEGDRVKKDQVLATLDGSSIQAEYDKAVKSLEHSKFEYDAAAKLFEEGAISQQELLAKKNTYDNNSITVNSFTGLEQTQIKSPINGTVTRVNTSRGRAANDTENKESMFVIEDLDNLQMKVKISEYDISKIKIGQNVTITSDVIGENSVSGVVSKIAPTGELKEQGSKEMVVPVTITVNKGSTGLMAGVTARAKILIEQKLGVLTVPVDALLVDAETGENNILCVKKGKNGNTVKKVPVTLGTEGNLNVEIISGDLKAGDSIVLSPTPDLADGTKVLPTPQQ